MSTSPNSPTQEIAPVDPEREVLVDAGMRPPPDRPELAQALVLLYKLSNEALRRIDELMEKLNIEFSEAAVKTGYVTEHELDTAMEWARRSALRQGRSIVEEVMRRTAQRRSVQLWQGEPLQPGPDLAIARETEGARSEVLRSLRSELLMRLNDLSRPAAIVTLSPHHGDGRTQLTAELAIAFAQLGRRTLLADADFRSPRLHELFGAENERGFAEAIANDSPPQLRGVVGLPFLSVLPAGAPPSNPAELLSSMRCKRLIAEWRRQFEVILLDTAPTAKFSDGISVANAAGHVVVVSRTSTTTFRALKEMARKLQLTQATALGAVINQF